MSLSIKIKNATDSIVEQRVTPDGNYSEGRSEGDREALGRAIGAENQIERRV